MSAYYCRFKIRKWYHLLSDGGQKHGLAEWRNGRRRSRPLPHAQRDGPPRTREKGVRDAGRITADSFRRNCRRSLYEGNTQRGSSLVLLTLSCTGFCIFVFFSFLVHIRRLYLYDTCIPATEYDENLRTSYKVKCAASTKTLSCFHETEITKSDACTAVLNRRTCEYKTSETLRCLPKKTNMLQAYAEMPHQLLHCCNYRC